jgi:hypothetical protein
MPPRDPFLPDGKDHTCKDCLRSFDSRGLLLRHRARSHEQVIPDPEPVAEVPS